MAINMAGLKLPLVLIAENIRSLHNVGSLFRSSDGAGIQKIILTGLTPTPPRHEISKTALGTVQTVAWEYQKDSLSAGLELKKAGYTLYSLEQTPCARNIFHIKLQGPAALVIGHEREGVESSTLAVFNNHLYIPMQGSGAHSLNVSNAASIALYEFARQLCYT